MGSTLDDASRQLADWPPGRLRAVGLGVVAGMRTQLPLALLALAARRQEGAPGDPLARLLRATPFQVATGLLTVGELIGDKLPMTPSRLDPGPLAGRFIFGALAGGIVAREAGDSPVTGALLGAAGAGVGAYAGYHLRAGLGRATALPDPLFGVLEDAAAIAVGLSAIGYRLSDETASRRVGKSASRQEKS